MMIFAGNSKKHSFIWILIVFACVFGMAYAESPEETAQRLVKDQEKIEGIQKPVIDGGQVNTSGYSIQGSSNTTPLISGRYLVHGDGTVTDTKEKLMWKRCAEGQTGENCSEGVAIKYIWDSAMYKFGKRSGYRFAGYDDWRLPTREELRTLVYCSNGVKQEIAWDKNCTNDATAGSYEKPTIDQDAFPNTGSEYPVFFWSSTQVEDNKQRAWYVSFSSGFDDKGNKGTILQVRLVRSIQ